ITDVHVLVAEDAIAMIDDAVLGRVCYDAASEAMGCAGYVEENFRKHAHRGASGGGRHLLGELIGLRNERRYPLAATDQGLPERREQGTLPAHVNVSLERLHAQQDHRLARPTKRLHDTEGLDRM